MFFFKKQMQLFQPKKREDGVVYASPKIRFFAMIVDLLIIAFLVQFFLSFLYFIYPHPEAPIAVFDKRKMGLEITTEEKIMFIKYIKHYFVINALQCVTAIFYFFIVWRNYQQTPAKMLLRIKIVDERTLKPLSTMQCIKRTAMAIVSLLFFCIGLLWVIVDRKNQSWHDKFANSIVVLVDSEGGIVRESDNSQDNEGLMNFVKNIIISYKKLIDRLMLYIIRRIDKKNK